MRQIGRILSFKPFSGQMQGAILVSLRITDIGSGLLKPSSS